MIQNYLQGTTVTQVHKHTIQLKSVSQSVSLDAAEHDQLTTHSFRPLRVKIAQKRKVYCMIL